MKSVHFTFNGADCTYFGFHEGYGLLVAVFLLLSAFLTWELGDRNCPAQMAPIGWALFFSYIGVTWISFKYFFAGPGALSAAVTILLGCKCIGGLQQKSGGID